MEINTQIAQKIKEARERLHLKAASVAHELGVAESTYSNLENGITQITVENIYKLAAILKVSLSSFISESQNTVYNIDKVDNLLNQGTQVNNYTDPIVKDVMQKLGELLIKNTKDAG